MLFQEIDKDKTRTRVDRLLKRYNSIRRTAGMPPDPKITASYTFTTSSTANTDNGIESAVFRKLEAEELLHEIQKAVNCLSGKSRQRLFFKYISEDSKFDYQIYMNMNISKDTYYRELQAAQIEFAEAYKAGELLVFKNQTK